MMPETEERVLAFYRSFPRIEHLQPIEIYDSERTWFDCPFEGGHGAYIRNASTDKTFDDRIVYCPVCDRHGWHNRASDVTRTLLGEETRMFALIRRFDGIEDGSLPASRVCVMWHSEGMPEEIAFDVVDDKQELRRLMQIHRSKSVNKFTAVYE